MTFIDHIRLDGEVSDLDRKDLIKEVVVVAAEIGDFGVVTFDHFDDSVEKARMLALPRSGFTQLPAINDVAVEDEVFAAILFKKPSNLLCFGSFRSEMYVRDDNGFKVGFQVDLDLPES
jgi:hypothetical protein